MTTPATTAASPASKRLLVVASLLAVYSIWGSTYLALRILVGHFPPLLGNALRLTIAGTLLYGWRRFRGDPRPRTRNLLAGVVVGCLLFVGGLGMVSLAESLGVGSGIAATAVAMMPVWASVMAGALGRWPTRTEWLGLALGLLGVIVLSQEGDFRANPLGLVLLVVAPMSWALGSTLTHRLPLPTGTMATAAEMLGGAAGLAVAGMLRGERLGPVGGPGGWVALLYLALLGSLVAFSAYAYLLRTVRPALATSYAYVNPVVAVVLGIGLGGERVTSRTWVALPLVVASVALIVRRRARLSDEPG